MAIIKLSKLKENILNKEKEFLINNQNLKLHRIADLLSFKGLVISELELREWYKIQGIKRENDSTGKKKYIPISTELASSVGYLPYGKKQKGSFKGNGGYNINL